MMRFQAGVLAVWLGPMLLLAACGSNVRHASRDLTNRLQTQLGSNITAGQAVVQPLPAGAQVSLTEPSVFPSGRTEPDENGRLVLASVVQGLLDPSLVQIQLADTGAAPATPLPATSLQATPLQANPIQPSPVVAGASPDGLQAARVQAVTQYLKEAALGPSLLPPGLPPGTAGAAGLVITINVQCPDRGGWPGYGSGKAAPDCR